MPDPEQPTSSFELRILEELSYIADRILTVENLLREMLVRLDGKTGREPVKVP
jgi:hypothetical protein